MQFEPTLRINPYLSPDELQTNYDDPTNPVFGFKYIHPDVSFSNRRLLLNTNSNYVGQIVLEKPYPDYQMYWSQIDDPLNAIRFDETKQSQRSNGERIYLSINLRRSVNDPGEMDDTPILRIQCPYISKDGHTFGYIKFDSIPDPDQAPFLIGQDLGYSRGVALPLKAISGGIDEVWITRDMLPRGQSRTLSFHFLCDGNVQNNKNPKLTGKAGGGADNDIRHLQLTVEYLGNSDIEIDWFRFETPIAQDLARGYFDEFIKGKVESGFEYFEPPHFVDAGVMPFRYYVHDEPNASGWFMMRYFNKLIGNIGTASLMNTYLPKQFEHYVNPPEHWIQKFKGSHQTAAPYFKSSMDQLSTFGLRNGYSKIAYPYPNHGNVDCDYKVSGYETFTRGFGNVWGNISIRSLWDLFYMNEDMFRKDITWRWAWLPTWEWGVMENYYGLSSITFH